MKYRLYRVLVLLLAALLISGSAASIAESGEAQFEYRLLQDGSAMITGFRGSGDTLALPDAVDGHPVTSLNKTFSYKSPFISDVKCLLIPETLTDIAPGALQFARSLTDIQIAAGNPALTFSDGALYNAKKQSLMLYLPTNTRESFEVPDGIREIEDKAFVRATLKSLRFSETMERVGSGCFDQALLTEIILNEGLKTIDAEAFTNCDRLQAITIPASVIEIGEAAFTDNRLKEIRVAPGNPVFTVSDGTLINLRDGVALAFPTRAEQDSCVIPEGVTRIGRFAFYRCHNLKAVSFPAGVQVIAHGAFTSCNHIVSFDLPDSLTVLEEGAFEGNSEAAYITIPAGVTEIGNNFLNCGKDLVIRVTPGSCAEQFCRDHALRCEPLGE